MANAYTQTVVTAPTAPSTTSVYDIDVMKPLILEKVNAKIIDEPMINQYINSERSYFTAQSLIDLPGGFGNLAYGQEVIVRIQKDQNPLSLVSKKEVSYAAVDECHDQIVTDCTMPCLNTLPEFAELKFRFDCEYSYGVRACAKYPEFWQQDFMTKQYAKSKAAYEFMRANDVWNKIVDGLVASPATTVDAAVATAYPNHFWNNMGTLTANGRGYIPYAYWYLKNAYADINPTVFIAPEAATELVRSVETPYNLNFSTQRVNTFRDWDLPGFSISSAVEEILAGIPVVIMKRSPWLTYANAGSLVSQYPLWNNDGTKQYVAILDPRVGYDFDGPDFELTIKPYDCDHLYQGIQHSIITASGLLWHQYGLIMAFDAFDFGPAAAPAGD